MSESNPIEAELALLRDHLNRLKDSDQNGFDEGQLIEMYLDRVSVLIQTRQDVMRKIVLDNVSEIRKMLQLQAQVQSEPLTKEDMDCVNNNAKEIKNELIDMIHDERPLSADPKNVSELPSSPKVENDLSVKVEPNCVEIKKFTGFCQVISKFIILISSREKMKVDFTLVFDSLKIQTFLCS